MAKADNFAKGRSRETIESTALAWRDAFGFSDAWSPDLIYILEHGLPQLDLDFRTIIKTKTVMGEDLGLTIFSPPQIILREDIYLGACQNDGRSRFTVAHELGHFLLHSGEARPRNLQLVDQTVEERFRSSEWQANAFAAAFLMPRHIVQQFSNKLELSECCNVSLAAAEIRMKELEWSKTKRPLPPIVIDFLKKNGKWPKDRDR